MGVVPFWPASDRRYSLGLTTAKNPTANDVLLGVGTAVTLAGVWMLTKVG